MRLSILGSDPSHLIQGPGPGFHRFWHGLDPPVTAQPIARSLAREMATTPPVSLVTAERNS